MNERQKTRFIGRIIFAVVVEQVGLEYPHAEGWRSWRAFIVPLRPSRRRVRGGPAVDFSMRFSHRM